MDSILLIVFFTAFGLQMVYWLLMLVSHLRYNPAKNKGDLGEGVSIIVCANNEIDNLKKLIPNLLNQDYSEYEIIIVNDRSTDGTYDYLLGIKGDKLKVVNIDTTPGHLNPKKYAITLAVKSAKYDWMLFTDADCFPQSNRWISSMANGFNKKSEFVLGYSQYLGRKGVLNALIRFETRMSGILYTTLAILGNPYMGVGRNMAYRKSTFLNHNGFNKYQSITGGDDDLMVNRYANKGNTLVQMGSDALVWSVPKLTWLHFLKQKIRHVSISKFYSFKDKFLLGLYSMCYLLFWYIFAILAVLNVYPEYVHATLALRLIILGVLINVTSKTFGERINMWLIPFLELLFVIYLTTVGICSVFTKKIKWR